MEFIASTHSKTMMFMMVEMIQLKRGQINQENHTHKIYKSYTKSENYIIGIYDKDAPKHNNRIDLKEIKNQRMH